MIGRCVVKWWETRVRGRKGGRKRETGRGKKRKKGRRVSNETSISRRVAYRTGLKASTTQPPTRLPISLFPPFLSVFFLAKR